MVTWYISHCLAEHSRLCEHSPNSPKTRPPMIFRFLRSNGVQVCTLSCSRTFFLRCLVKLAASHAQIWQRYGIEWHWPLVDRWCWVATLLHFVRKEIGCSWPFYCSLASQGHCTRYQSRTMVDFSNGTCSAHTLEFPYLDGAHFIKSRSVASYISIQTPF